MQSPSQCFTLLFGFRVFPSFHQSGRAEGRVPAASAAALSLALRVPHTLPPGSQNLGCILELLINPLCEDVGFDTTPSTRTFTREQKSLLHGAGIPPWCSHKSFEPSVGALGLAVVGRGSPQAQGSHLVQTSRFIFQGMNSCRVHSRLLLQKPLLCTTGQS